MVSKKQRAERQRREAEKKKREQSPNPQPTIKNTTKPVSVSTLKPPFSENNLVLGAVGVTVTVSGFPVPVWTLFTKKANIAVAHLCAQNHCSADRAATLNFLFFDGFVHILGFAADKGFVNFDNARLKRIIARFNRFSDAMAKIPSRFVSNIQSAFELVGRNPFARFAQQIDSGKPFLKRQMRVMKNRVNRYGKLIIAGIANKLIAFIDARNFIGFTAQTKTSSGKRRFSR